METISTKRTTKTLAEVFGMTEGLPPANDALSYVPLDRIVPSRWQPRIHFDPAALLDLANDIRVHGLLTPPLVWQNEDGEYELIAGERRLRALYALVFEATGVPKKFDDLVADIARLGIGQLREELPGRLADPACPQWLRTVACRYITASPAELHEIALVDNLQRADLSPVEEARALQDLLTEYGYTQRQLGERLGKSQTYISQRLTLLRLAPEVAERVVAGEIEPATAREIARLEPAVQDAAVAHLQQHNMKSKTAQVLVQRILDYSDPARYTPPTPEPDQVGAQDAALYRLAQIGLEHLPDAAARQAAILRYAGLHTDGKAPDPKDEYALKDIATSTGVFAGRGGNGRTFDTHNAWENLAPAAGYTCATCQLNPHRDEVAAVNAIVVQQRESYCLSWSRWPRCAPNVETCPAYTPAGEPLRLPVPYLDHGQAYTDEERPHLVGYNGQSRPDAIADVPAWSAILRRAYAAKDAREAERLDQAQHGVARALTTYIQLQQAGAIDLTHFWTQPCATCAFSKAFDADGQRAGDPAVACDPTAACRKQAQPPTVNGWDNVITRTYQSGEVTIGRCRLYRLKDPAANLPDLPGAGPALTPAAVLALLAQLCAADYNGRYGPAWLDVEHAGLSLPSWSKCEPYLVKLLPTLTPGQRLALIYRWRDPFGLWQSTREKAALDVYHPGHDRLVPYHPAQDIVAA